MQVEAIPLTDFAHGRINAREGHPLWLDEHLAADLERASLIRIRLAHAKPVIEKPGKSPDDGQGQSSSASQAAPASPTTTSQSSGRGPGRPRKNAV